MVVSVDPANPKRKKPAVPHAGKVTKNARIELVRKLAIRGVTRPTEIQAYFKRQDPPIHVTTRTISRYKAIIKRRSAKALREKEGLNQSLEEIVYDMKTNYREVARELWSVFHAEGTPAAVKVRALLGIQKINDEHITKLQSLGFIHREPDKVQAVGADGRPIDPTMNVNVEQLNAQFVAFIKAKHQDPIGHNKSHEPIERTLENGGTTSAQTA